jgi:hypothetical protein
LALGGFLLAALQVVLIIESPTNGIFYVTAALGLGLALICFINYRKNKRL